MFLMPSPTVFIAWCTVFSWAAEGSFSVPCKGFSARF
jgi:hypothetical protein